MRKLYCYSMKSFKELVYENGWDKKLPENIAVISIIGSEKLRLDDETHILESSDRVLNLEFDDITPNDMALSDVKLFDVEQANEAYKFILYNINTGHSFFIHCAAGMSRSQAFIKFITDNWPQIDWGTNPNNPCRFPNFHVCHLLNEQYRIHHKTLNLVLKGKWFDMIANGIKKEEYREIKPYWDKQIGNHIDEYGYINFHKGYTNNTMLVECKGICKGLGNTEWGAPGDKEVYILSLGEII